MAGINGLKVMANLSTCIAEAFGTADAYFLFCLQSLDTPGEEFGSILRGIAIFQDFQISYQKALGIVRH